jgi:hypothetical protein
MKIVRLADILAEIGKEVLLNSSPEYYRYTNLLGLNVAAPVNYIHKSPVITNENSEITQFLVTIATHCRP